MKKLIKVTLFTLLLILSSNLMAYSPANLTACKNAIIQIENNMNNLSVLNACKLVTILKNTAATTEQKIVLMNNTPELATLQNEIAVQYNILISNNFFTENMIDDPNFDDGSAPNVECGAWAEGKKRCKRDEWKCLLAAGAATWETGSAGVWCIGSMYCVWDFLDCMDDNDKDHPNCSGGIIIVNPSFLAPSTTPPCN